MNSNHYIIFEADGDEGSNKFYVDANKVYMETHMTEGIKSLSMVLQVIIMRDT